MKRLASRLGRWFNHRGLRLALVLLLLGALLTKIDRVQLGQRLERFDPVYGLLAAGVFALLVGLFALRWWTIASALGIRAPLREFARITWITQAVSELGPALVVGELTRFQLMRGFGDGWPLAVSQGMDRLSGKLVLFLMVVVLTPVYLHLYGDFPVRQLIFFAFLLLAAVSVFILVARRFWPLARTHSAVVRALASPLASPRHYAVSLLIQCLLAANIPLSALALGIAHDLPMLFVLGLLLLLGVGSLPGLVSDWGKREAAAILVLAPAGLSAEESVAVSLVFGALHLIVALPGALFLLVERRRARRSGIPRQRPPRKPTA